MRTNMRVMAVSALAAIAAVLTLSPAFSQDRPANNFQIMADKIRADKKLLVAVNMDLSEAEAKGFWPVYEEYQKDLEELNRRIGKLIEIYAAEYKADTLTDEKAGKLIDELVAIEQAEGGLHASYVPNLSKVLPSKKVARYLQIENKIRAVVRYDLAEHIPIVR